MKKKLPKAARKFDVGKTLPPQTLRHRQTEHQQRAAGGTEEKLLKKPRRGWKSITLRVFLGILAAFLTFVLVIAIWDARNINHATQKLFGSSVFSLLSTSDLTTGPGGRVNILLVGYSVDDPGHPAASLTDSILLLSLNSNNHSGYVLSIPRDLYVRIPGHGYGKINEAYQDGGIGLLNQIVSDSFGVSAPYYALINYSAVRNTVNALGGINVCIQSPDSRGLYDPNISPVDGGPLRLPNGCQTLDGQTALNLTRARGETAPDGRASYGFPRSDFDRTQHQRQVFTAIKQKISWKLILDPRKNGQLFDAVANNVKAGVEAGEALPLYRMFNSIESADLQSVSLNNLGGRNYLTGYRTPTGQSALIPAAGLNDFVQIQSAIRRL